jgi:hypothetical protein
MSDMFENNDQLFKTKLLNFFRLFEQFFNFNNFLQKNKNLDPSE